MNGASIPCPLPLKKYDDLQALLTHRTQSRFVRHRRRSATHSGPRPGHIVAFGSLVGGDLQQGRYELRDSIAGRRGRLEAADVLLARDEPRVDLGDLISPPRSHLLPTTMTSTCRARRRGGRPSHAAEGRRRGEIEDGGAAARGGALGSAAGAAGTRCRDHSGRACWKHGARPTSSGASAELVLDDAVDQTSSRPSHRQRRRGPSTM
jgi:hypothetical protein